MESTLKYILLIIVFFSFAQCSNTKKTTSESQNTPLEAVSNNTCGKVLRYLKPYWNGERCEVNKGMAAEQIANLVNEEKCYKGMHIDSLTKYLGAPDWIKNGWYNYAKGFPETRKDGGEYVGGLNIYTEDSLISWVMVVYGSSVRDQR